MSSIACRALRITKLGDPKKVLELTTHKVSNVLSGNEVLVKWLASPINPLDINRIEGTYPGSEAPKIGGSEAIGIVEKVGSKSTLRQGDHVISLFVSDLWSELSVVDDDSLVKIRKDVDLLAGATLLINPPTAYVMLKDIVSLEAGDYVIQNSANSGVGRAVIEIAHAFGYKTINLVRDRPEISVLKDELRSLGADLVFTEEEFRKEGRKIANEYDIKLALNGVGGKSALMISSALVPGGTMVTYGGMSKQASQISTSSFVFKGIRACGVAIGPWMQIPENKDKVLKMFEDLQQLIVKGKLHAPPTELHDISDFSTAIDRTIEGRNKKQVLLIHPDYKNIYPAYSKSKL
ncbi:hypothetical protein FO519_001290 [Halicephalobus sp. NKZ332]|nr:hypothetical protein FO519_001290 [Halicephalobus sp. NKZ332]